LRACSQSNIIGPAWLSSTVDFMIAFEVRVNKVKVCTAGMGSWTALSRAHSTINKDGRPDQPKIAFHISGVADKEAVNWVQESLGLATG